MEKIKAKIGKVSVIDTPTDINIRNKGKLLGIPEVSNDSRKKLNEEVYTWYISGDRWLLKLMCNRGKFREDIIKMCPLCNKKENSREHAINECESTYYLRRDLISKIRKEVKVKKGT